MKLDEYLCKSCGKTFDAPLLVKEYHNDRYLPPEEFRVCPFCLEHDVDHVYICDECGKVITGEAYATKDGQDFCAECYEVSPIGDVWDS